jgi:DNA-binding transcriptional LysR family regulator
LRHLRYAIAAAECGGFRRAAKALNVQESAVSRRIRELEDEIGASLFIRQSSGVILTHAGKQLIRRAREALESVAQVKIDTYAAGRGEEGSVRIGIFSSLASGFLSQLLRDYSARHDRVLIELIEGAPSQHIVGVQKHCLDVAFVTGIPSLIDCDVQHFWTERVFVALPAVHPLVARRKVNVSETDPGPEIYDYLIKHLADLGVHPAIQRCAVGRDNLMQIVSLGHGLTLTSEATIATRFPGVVYKPLEYETLPFSAVWSPRNDNPAFRRLLSLARTMAKQNASKIGLN